MAIVIRFILGAAFGSFVNVIALRYEGNAFLFGNSVIGGRSRCPGCRITLRWFELVPFFSFVVQGGKCRHCGASLSWRYPAVEFLGGLIVAFVPIRIAHYFALAGFSPLAEILLSYFWVMAFFLLFLLALIDMRLYLIPNEVNVLLGAIGIAIGIIMTGYSSPAGFSLLGFHAILAGFVEGVWQNRAVALLFGMLFFGFLTLISRGCGMGLGDVKLAGALGLLLGWPDVVAVTAIAFVIGACAGVFAIGFRKKKIKSLLPFGPFLALAVAMVFFWGDALTRGYFQLFFL